MKIPALFKNNDLLISAMKKEYSSEVSARSSCFFEWKESTPVEITFHAKKDSHLECVFLQNLPLDAELPAHIKMVADQGSSIKCTIVHQGAFKSQITLDSNCAGEGSSIHIQALANTRNEQKHSLIANALHSVPLSLIHI